MGCIVSGMLLALSSVLSDPARVAERMTPYLHEIGDWFQRSWPRLARNKTKVVVIDWEVEEVEGGYRHPE